MHFTSHWDETEIPSRLQAAEDATLVTELVYRAYTSQLIGQVPDLVMHGGGNTSCKSAAVDLNGEEIGGLCVKGSGWDLGTIEAPGLPEANYLVCNFVGKQVEARHVADGLVFLARTDRTTGHIFTVDVGNGQPALR